MKTLLLLIFFSLVNSIKILAQEKNDLFQELKHLDSVFFEKGFNRCDLTYLENKVADELRFYHDQNGFQNKNMFLKSIEESLCSNFDKKPIRKVDPNSLEVFPLFNNGKIYGAIQTGIHHFYIREKEKKDLWTSTAKFTHLWILENGSWYLTEVLSYDHQSTNPPRTETN